MFYTFIIYKYNIQQLVQVFNPITKTHENFVNINMEINPNTLKKKKSKQNKRIRIRKKISSTYEREVAINFK